MSDNGKDSRIIGLDHVPKSRRNRKSRPVTVDEAREWIAAGSIAAMRNVYESLASENSRLFEQMEQIAVDRVLAELERRSLRGRIRAWWSRVRGSKPELVPEVPAVPAPEAAP